jgi:PilZ domain
MLSYCLFFRNFFLWREPRDFSNTGSVKSVPNAQEETMTTSQVRIERRAAQRFDLHRSVSVRRGNEEGLAFTQDLSTRGMFLYTDMVLRPDDDLELVLDMPSEITLSADTQVRCQVRVLRVTPAASNQKSGVAVLVRNYEFLQESNPAASLREPAPPLDPDSSVMTGGHLAWSGSSIR